MVKPRQLAWYFFLIACNEKLLNEVKKKKKAGSKNTFA